MGVREEIKFIEGTLVEHNIATKNLENEFSLCLREYENVMEVVTVSIESLRLLEN